MPREEQGKLGGNGKKTGLMGKYGKKWKEMEGNGNKQ